MYDNWLIVTIMFESLDFLYVPAPNIQESIRYYTKVLAGELLWKIHAYGVWVACIRLSDKQPYILLADHIEQSFFVFILLRERLVLYLNKYGYNLLLY